MGIAICKRIIQTVCKWVWGVNQIEKVKRESFRKKRKRKEWDPDCTTIVFTRLHIDFSNYLQIGMWNGIPISLYSCVTSNGAFWYDCLFVHLPFPFTTSQFFILWLYNYPGRYIETRISPLLLWSKMALFCLIIDMAKEQSKGSLKMDGVPLHAIIWITFVMEQSRLVYFFLNSKI